MARTKQCHIRKGDISMRMKIGNLPGQYSMIIDISPKNAATIKVELGQQKMVLAERVKLPGKFTSVQTQVTDNELQVQLVTPTSEVWGEISVNLSTGEIVYEHQVNEGAYNTETHTLA